MNILYYVYNIYIIIILLYVLCLCNTYNKTAFNLLVYILLHYNQKLNKFQKVFKSSTGCAQNLVHISVPVAVPQPFPRLLIQY